MRSSSGFCILAYRTLAYRTLVYRALAHRKSAGQVYFAIPSGEDYIVIPYTKDSIMSRRRSSLSKLCRMRSLLLAVSAAVHLGLPYLGLPYLGLPCHGRPVV